MKKTILISVSIFLSLFIFSAYAVTWVQKSNYPIACRDACAFVFQSDICVATGYNGNYLTSGYAFTPSVNYWYLNFLPTFTGDPRSSCICGGHSTFAFIGLGQPIGFGTNNFYGISSSSLNWSSNISYNSNVGSSEAFSVMIGSDIYAGTGISGFSYDNSFWKYTFSVGSWTQLANVPSSDRKGAFAFNINGTIYAGGGSEWGGGPLNDFYSFNTSTNTWTTLPSLPSGREDAVAFSIGNYGYVGLGNDVNGSGTVLYNDFLQYNPSTQTWTNIGSFPGLPRLGAVGVAYNGKGYVGLGVTSGGVYKNDWWEFTPSPTTDIEESSNNLSEIKFYYLDHEKIKLSGFDRSKNYQVSLYDIQGKKLIDNNISRLDYFEFPIQNFSKGIYSVQILSHGSAKSFKFTKT